MSSRFQQAVVVHWIRGFVELLLEVEAGRRPRRHLRRLVHPDFYTRLGGDPIPPHTTAVVGTVRLQSRPGSHEAAVTVVHSSTSGGARVRVLAVAMRPVDGIWVVTEACGPEARDVEIASWSQEEDAELAWTDLAEVDRVEPQDSPTWQLPAGWRRPVRAA
ncbi:Rv3235 family protein [Euzebya tangerina]|uniref:Rv3235 family protein n=1 Tax=Euzebya tangerina TaxID=591198 RepID=UPI000E313800|nr:Rv3235 family protein [Euzebya tangerina]